MGSGGSLTPWSPSNEAGVGQNRVSIDVRAIFTEYNHPLVADDPKAFLAHQDCR